MANLPFPTLRKRRTREHIIADLSINHVERHILLCGHAVERIRMDYGLDLIVHTHNRLGEVENGRIMFQVKATDRPTFSRDRKSIRCRVDTRDLVYWEGDTEPVILIQYDARSDVAYWVHVQEDLKNRNVVPFSSPNRQVSMFIPRLNVFDKNAMTGIAIAKNITVAQLKVRRSDATD